MSQEYNFEDFQAVIESYKRIFGDEFFNTLPKILSNDQYGYNLLISDPRKITFSKTKEIFGEEGKDFDEKLAAAIRTILQGQGFSLGLTPWTDYYLSISHKYNRGNVLVVAHDWYPLKGSLDSALKKQLPIGKYKEGFDIITDREYLPIFINLVPGLRGGYEIIDNDETFKQFHCIEYLESVVNTIKPKIIVTWGLPVYYRFIENYCLSNYEFSIGDGSRAITIGNHISEWIPMYHPSSGGHWNGPKNRVQKDKLKNLLS